MIVNDETELLAGLDLGTTSVSAVAIRRDGGTAHAVTRNHNAAVPGISGGYAEQDPARILTTARHVLRELATACRSSRIVCLGMTGQMHSTVLLDKSCRPLTSVITWQDRRAVVESGGSTILERLLARCSIEALQNTGGRLAAGYLGTTMFALQELGQLPDRLHSVSLVADWVAGQLTEQTPVTDRSHAASSGLFDFRTDDWSDELIRATGMSRGMLPDVRESGVPIGRLSAAAAAETSLPSGIPVCNAIGDNQASVLGCLPESADTILINIGTGGQIVWHATGFCHHPWLDTRYLPSDRELADGEAGRQFMMVGAGLCGGDSLAWINRVIRSWLSVFGVERTDAEVWDSLTRQVCGIDAAGLVCEPFFRGTRREPGRRGVFHGITEENFTPGHVALSILRGIAQSMHEVYTDSGRAVECQVQNVVMSGNGSRRNPLLVEAVRQRFGVPVQVARQSEEAATGAAILAGVRQGFWESIDTARRRVQEHGVEP